MLYASFRSHRWIQTGVTTRKRPIWVKTDDFLALWPWNLTYDLEKQQGTSSILLQALCVISFQWVNSNFSYSPETPTLGQIQQFLEPCDLEIWWMTSKNNRAPLIINIYASFHHHMWIRTWVTVLNRLSSVVTSVTLTLHELPWPFAWTLLLSLVITPENFMMIQWWEQSQKGVTYRRTDKRKMQFVELLGRSQKHTFKTWYWTISLKSVKLPCSPPSLAHHC